MFEATIESADPQSVVMLFGPRDQHVRAIRDTLGVSIVHRDGQIRIAGEEKSVTKATETLTQMKGLLDRGQLLSPDDVSNLLAEQTGKTPAGTSTGIDIISTAKKI